MNFPHAESAAARVDFLGKWLKWLAFSAAILAGPAHAGGMLTGGLTSQPIGHFEFCKSHPAECNIRNGATEPLHLTDSLWQAIVTVNQTVNRTVAPESDADLYGKDEVWTYPNGRGDCEDYVLQKRRELAALGISLADLLITVVRKPDGEGHAVLTLRADEGDFILDNLNDAVRQWNETGYKFLKRQSTENTGQWVAIRADQTPVVASVD